MQLIRVMVLLGVCAALLSCGESSERATGKAAAPPSPDPRQPDRPADEESEADADGSAQANDANEEGAGEAEDGDHDGVYSAGPAWLHITTEVLADDIVSYTIRITDEAGTQGIRWEGRLPDRTSDMKLHVEPARRNRRPISAASANIFRVGNSLRVRGDVVGADDAEFKFDLDVPIAGYQPPEPKPAPQPLAPDGRAPLAELIDDGVHNTPGTIRELLEAAPVGESAFEYWLIADAADDGPDFVSYTAVNPSADGVTFETRMYNSAGWRLASVADCAADGKLLRYAFQNGIETDSVMYGETQATPGSPVLFFTSYYKGSEDQYASRQGDADIDPRQLDPLPMALEHLAVTYHRALGHDRFLIRTTDFMNDNGVINYALYERQADETIQAGREDVVAEVYRYSITSVATGDTVNSESFGQVTTFTVYIHPDGRWLKTVGDDFSLRSATVEEAATALGATPAELIGPVPSVEDE